MHHIILKTAAGMGIFGSGHLRLGKGITDVFGQGNIGSLLAAFICSTSVTKTD
jgi:hypothetical protein